MKRKNLKEMKKRVLALLLCITVIMNGGISTFAEETTQPVHEHTEECMTRVKTDKLVCEKPEVEEAAVHKHVDDACYEITSAEKLICGLEVTEGHKHGDGCYTPEKKLNCEVSEHKHTDACYVVEKILTCAMDEVPAHNHNDACYELTEGKTLTCKLEETEAHTHGDECYEWVEALNCEFKDTKQIKEEPENEELETEEPKAEEVEELTKTEYSAEGEDSEVKVAVILENAADLPDDAELITEPETLDEDETAAIEETAKAAGVYIEKMTALDIRFEREVAGEEGAAPTIENPQPANPVNVSVVLPDITAEDEVTVYHVSKETVTDENGEEKEVFKVEDMDASVNAETGAVEFKTSHFSTYVVIKNIDTAVAVVIAMIDQLPTYEEVAEALAKFEAEEDWEGYENYIKDLAEKAWKAYYAYEALNEEEKALVTNYERLMETSGVWSVMTLPNNPDTAATKYYSPSSEFWTNSKPASECDCTWELTNDGKHETHETHENCIPVKHKELIPSAYGANGLTLGAKSADEIVISEFIKDNCVKIKDTSYGPNFDAKTLVYLDSHNYETTVKIYDRNDTAESLAKRQEDLRNGYYLVYRNVGTYKGQSIDLKIQYKDAEVYNKEQDALIGLKTIWDEGEVIVPEINVHNVAWVEMEYTFYEAGTDTEIPVKGNTSYYDVDANQAVYMKDNCKGVYLTNGCKLWIGQLDDDPNACGLYQGKARITYDRYDPSAAFTEIFEGKGFTRVFSFSSMCLNSRNQAYINNKENLTQEAYDWIDENVSYASGTIGHSGRPVVLDGVLYINKTVQGTTGNVSNEKYDFKITFSDETMNTSDTVSYGDVNVINGVAEFTLGHGDAVQISGLQAGVGYTVEEINTAGRMYTTVNGVEGTSISGTVESVTETSEIPVISFVNIPVEVITDKKVSGDNEDDMVLTLDAFATGSLSSMVKTKPADIVVVFDHSGSMLKALEAKRKLTSFTQLETEKGKIEGYYVSSKDRETVFLLYKNDTWYYVESDNTKFTPLNWDGAFAESNFSDNKLLEVDSETQKILEENGIYQTRYGAAYDALMEFTSMMQKTGIDHRLAITTFAHGEQGGTGVFIDGTFYQYKTFTESGKSYKDALEDISDETSVKNIKQSIEKLYSGWGYTYTNIGLTMANNILDTLDTPGTDTSNGKQERDRMVVLLSDGLPSNDKIGKEESKKLALAQAKIAKSKHNATIYAIGVLGENDTDAANVLQRISSNYDYSDIDTPNMSNGKVVSDKYYQNVTSDAAMKLAFGNVVLQVGGTQIQLDHTAILRDTLSAEFQLDSARDIQVYTADCSGYADGKYTFGERTLWEKGTKLQDDDEAVLDINVNGATIDVTGFDYEKYYVAVGDNGSGEQVARGCKLIVEIPIKAADDNLGGIKQATNDDDQTGIYDGDLRVEEFPDPYADVPVKVEVIKHIDGISTSESFAFNASYDRFIGYSNIPSEEINGSNYLNAIRPENKATDSRELTDYDVTNDVWVLQDVLAGGTVTVTEDDSERYEMSVSVTHLDKNGNRVASEYSLSGNGVEVKNVKPGTRIEFTNKLYEGDVTTEKEVKDRDGKLWIDLKAYTTGYASTISKIKPTDIILVLDHSGSMFHAVHIGESATIKTNAGQTAEEYQIADAISYDELNAKEELKNIYAAGHRGYYMMINANEKSIWCVQYDGTQWLKYEMKPESADTLYKGRVKSYCADSTGEPLSDSDKDYGFFYKSIYGESCDALKVFLDEVNGTQNCRVAMVGFAGADEQQYIGSGVYKDGAFWQYDSQMYASEDFKTKVFEKVDTTEGMDALYASLAAYQPKYNTTATNVGLRITQILMQKATDQETTPVVVIFTDGEPTVTNMGHGYSNEWNGLSKSEQARNHAIALATELKQGKCIVGKEEHYKTQIFTIAPESTQVDKEYLESLASPGKAFTAAAGAMTGVFRTVAETVTASATALDEESILRDVLSADFVLDESGDRDIEIYLSKYENGAFVEDVLIDADAHEEGCDDCTDIKAVVDGNTIEVTGFDYSAHCVVGANEKAAKIVVRVPIVPSDTNLGGNQQKTNDHAEIEDDGKVVKPFPDPYVDIPTTVKVKKLVAGTYTESKFNFMATYTTLDPDGRYTDNPNEEGGNYLQANPEVTSWNKELGDMSALAGTETEWEKISGVLVGTAFKIKEEENVGYSMSVKIEYFNEEGERVTLCNADPNAEDASLIGYTIDEEGYIVIPAELNARDIEITFTNTTLYELPSTGGIGTYLYSISGPVLMMGAALILYRMKRKEVLGRQ